MNAIGLADDNLITVIFAEWKAWHLAVHKSVDYGCVAKPEIRYMNQAHESGFYGTPWGQTKLMVQN